MTNKKKYMQLAMKENINKLSVKLIKYTVFKNIERNKNKMDTLY